ncbi:MAG: hypothetical protein WBO45_00270 [Planctomycetota bacterium]
MLGISPLGDQSDWLTGVAARQQDPLSRAPARSAAEVAPWQRDLLQLAFDAASAFPLDPHRKNRGRAQDVVVRACFTLGMQDVAVGYGGQIADWRRGTAYAEFAACLAARGEAARARDYIALAERVAKAEREAPAGQEWRCDLIALQVARAWTLLGDPDAASKAAARIEPNSTNAVDDRWATTAAERVRSLAAGDADRELAAIDAAFPTMSLGQQHTAMVTLANLHERFFTAAAVRTFCEQRVAKTWERVTPALRLDALERLVRTNISNGDVATARNLLATMRTIVDGHAWRAEDRMPQLARLVELTAATGDRERARADAEAALAAWHAERETIVNIWRARALRPLALAFHALGERARCQELLALVLEESLENPNSRPRCDDLVDTCTALAIAGVEPSAGLWTRLREIRTGLGHPW